MSRIGRGLAYGAFVVGAGAIGFAAGLLLAPASGMETRRRLGRRIEEDVDALKRKGRRTLQDLGERAIEQIDEGRQKLSELVHS